MKHRIVITGGGTGGHIYPALAVHEQLADDSEVEDVLYIGAKGHLEERLTAERRIKFVGLGSAGMPRRLSPALLAWPFKMLAAWQDAQSELNRFRPTAVLGTGGYASAPPLAAALRMGVPYIVHEPDAFPGLVNRTFARWAVLCSLGMEGARHRIGCSQEKVVVNGNPLARTFSKLPGKSEARVELKLDPQLRTLLVTGGSQGAQAINDALRDAIPQLQSIEPAIQILHQVGEKNFAAYKSHVDTVHLSPERYQIRPYIDNIAVAYAACDLAVCRAGAMTIAELAVTGTPAVFVPYPFAAQDHQTNNARFVESQGAAIVIPQNLLAASSLYESVREIIANDGKIAQMQQAMVALAKPNAAADVAKQLKQLSANYQK